MSAVGCKCRHLMSLHLPDPTGNVALRAVLLDVANVGLDLPKGSSRDASNVGSCMQVPTFSVNLLPRWTCPSACRGCPSRWIGCRPRSLPGVGRGVAIEVAVEVDLVADERRPDRPGGRDARCRSRRRGHGGGPRARRRRGRSSARHLYLSTGSSPSGSGTRSVSRRLGSGSGVPSSPRQISAFSSRSPSAARIAFRIGGGKPNARLPGRPRQSRRGTTFRSV